MTLIPLRTPCPRPAVSVLAVFAVRRGKLVFERLGGPCCAHEPLVKQFENRALLLRFGAPVAPGAGHELHVRGLEEGVRPARTEWFPPGAPPPAAPAPAIG